MEHIRRITTREREVSFIDFDGVEVFANEQPAIDEALGLLTWQTKGQTRFTGNEVTSWRDGGMREPQTPGLGKETRRKKIMEPLREQLPPRYTGIAVFRMNRGELSGEPVLIPFT